MDDCIETLLATQRCCYPACLSANFRPVVSMNISVGSHFSSTPCACNKLYILYSRGGGGNYLTAWRHRNSPVSSQIKALAWEKLRLIQQKSNLLFRANEIQNAFCHFVFIILPLQSSVAYHLVGMQKKKKKKKKFLLSSWMNCPIYQFNNTERKLSADRHIDCQQLCIKPSSPCCCTTFKH